MAALKKGNIMAHARASGKKVMFAARAASSIVKKAVARSAAPKKRVVKRKPVRAAVKKQYKYQLQVRKSERGLWQKLLGADSLANITAIAKMYARKYPRHAFRVV